MIAAAFAALGQAPCELIAASRIIESAPQGPSLRRYGNAAAIIASDLSPLELLGHVQRIERSFGRGRSQRRGQRWRARVLDIDLILWSGGAWASPALAIPHPLFAARRFVLDPASEVARHWRDPLRGLSIAHWQARLARQERCAVLD